MMRNIIVLGIPYDVVNTSYYITQAYNYISLPGMNIDQNYFNAQEISHLHDVRFLLGVIWVVFLISLTVVILGWRKAQKVRMDWPKFAKSALIFTTLGLIGLLVVSFTDFRTIFILFHEIIFPGGNWSFDPATSNMIRLFPEQFFVNFCFAYVILLYILQFCLFATLKLKAKL